MFDPYRDFFLLIINIYWKQHLWKLVKFLMEEHLRHNDFQL